MKGRCDAFYLFRILVPRRPTGFSIKASDRLKKCLTIEDKTMAANVLETPIIAVEYKRGGAMEEAACQLAFVLDAVIMQRKSIGVVLDDTLNTAAFGLTVDLENGSLYFYALCWNGDEEVRLPCSMSRFL